MFRSFKKTIDSELSYRCKKCTEMTEDEIIATSELFSAQYGKWAKNHPDPKKAGQPIRFSAKMIRLNFVNKPDRYVAMVYHKNNLIAHVFYMRRNIDQERYVIWMLQLVVNEKYRGQHIGTKLMHSIWGLSDAFAWGLYTSNPLTIHALEEATMRKINIRLIDKYIGLLKEIAHDLFPDNTWLRSYRKGVVNTNFWTDHSNISQKILRYYDERERKFPLTKNLPDGHEWLAFTFRSQALTLKTPSTLESYYNFSDSILIEAYSKMKMDRQGWARHHEQEIEKIIPFLAKGSSILDLGCGQGRHSRALAERGYNVVGVDFSPHNIEQAIANNNTSAVFLTGDARTYRSSHRFDAVICLYDVVGSYPDPTNNKKILRTAHAQLKSGGKLFLSVLNATLTERLCREHQNTVSNEESALNRVICRSGSNTMQQTGQIFNGSQIVIDTSSGICYRKEQFFSKDSLPKEYLIRDTRYTFHSIETILKESGFIIDDMFCFQSGHIDIRLKPTDSKAKEIFVIAHKPSRREAFHSTI